MVHAPPHAKAPMVGPCTYGGGSMVDAPPQVQAPTMGARAYGGASTIVAHHIFFKKKKFS